VDEGFGKRGAISFGERTSTKRREGKRGKKIAVKRPTIVILQKRRNRFTSQKRTRADKGGAEKGGSRGGLRKRWLTGTFGRNAPSSEGEMPARGEGDLSSNESWSRGSFEGIKKRKKTRGATGVGEERAQIESTPGGTHTSPGGREAYE